MSDPTSNKQYMRRQELDVQSYPMDGAAQHLYIGQMVMSDATGYAVKAADTLACRFLGVAIEEKNQPDAVSDGTNRIRVQTKGTVKLVVTSVAATDVGKPVWVTDSGALQLTPGEVFAGWVDEYVSSGVAFVELAGDYQLPREYLMLCFPGLTGGAASQTYYSKECHAIQRNCKILKATAAALVYPNYDTTTITIYKYNLDDTTDKEVVSAADIDNKTAKQVTDLTLTSTAEDLLLTAGDTLRGEIATGTNEVAEGQSFGVTIEIEVYDRPNQ